MRDVCQLYDFRQSESFLQSPLPFKVLNPTQTQSSSNTKLIIPLYTRKYNAISLLNPETRSVDGIASYQLNILLRIWQQENDTSPSEGAIGATFPSKVICYLPRDS